MGDLPIYVAPASADVAAHPELFVRTEVAGAPPDALNPNGQLWGNPLYHWPANRTEGWRWWTERFRRSLELVDLTRIDHFRGFVAAWGVDPSAKTAKGGRWHHGPGVELFEAVQDELGPLPVVAEDLGLITPAVQRLRDELGFMGMRVLEFGFLGGSRNIHALANHPVNSVLYTGTHDLDPLAGWWEHASAAVRRRALSELRAAGIGDDPVWGLIRLAFSSHASLVMLQMQDVLGLGSEARFNTPGTTRGNWRWRLEPGALTTELAARLRDATAESGRLKIGT
jgi:4-alpha-glucanotransferase